MKMKVIDLINMHARNEEMPKQIKVGDCNEVLTYDGYNYTLDGTPLDGFLDFFECLNKEVEIIEEDKTNKIEKIDVTIKYLSNNLNDCVLEDISNIQIKLNEVIDAVNKLSKDN